MHTTHFFANSLPEAAALSIKAGTDWDLCGGFTPYLVRPLGKAGFSLSQNTAFPCGGVDPGRFVRPSLGGNGGHCGAVSKAPNAFSPVLSLPSFVSSDCANHSGLSFKLCKTVRNDAACLSVRRVLRARFELGDFDPEALVTNPTIVVFF